METIDDIAAEPLGLCACRCGGHTKLATRADLKHGHAKGQPLKYIHGHNRRKALRYVEADGGYETPCWLWRLAKNGTGYGRITINGRHVTAHRHYYEREHGPLPDGVELDHLCRVRCCVNPRHLEPVTHAENARRGLRTKLTSVQVAEIRGSSETQREIARRNGITQGHVSRIRRGKTWCDARTTV